MRRSRNEHLPIPIMPFSSISPASVTPSKYILTQPFYQHQWDQDSTPHPPDKELWHPYPSLSTSLLSTDPNRNILFTSSNINHSTMQRSLPPIQPITYLWPPVSTHHHRLIPSTNSTIDNYKMTRPSSITTKRPLSTTPIRVYLRVQATGTSITSTSSQSKHSLELVPSPSEKPRSLHCTVSPN